jgi:hypothetical protein
MKVTDIYYDRAYHRHVAHFDIGDGKRHGSPVWTFGSDRHYVTDADKKRTLYWFNEEQENAYEKMWRDGEMYVEFPNGI